jgi:hypothetical protein
MLGWIVFEQVLEVRRAAGREVECQLTSRLIRRTFSPKKHQLMSSNLLSLARKSDVNQVFLIAHPPGNSSN